MRLLSDSSMDDFQNDSLEDMVAVGLVESRSVSEPLIEGNFFPVLQIAAEQVFHLSIEVTADDHRVGLVVVQKAAVIEIARSHRRPYPVDHRGLGMQHGVSPLVESDSCFQQLAVAGVGGAQRHPGIAEAG